MEEIFYRKRDVLSYIIDLNPYFPAHILEFLYGKIMELADGKQLTKKFVKHAVDYGRLLTDNPDAY
ncbi:hypothetical protein ACFL20_13890 [Spirochaetota bacterium]